MNLSDLITRLPFQPEPDRRWAILGAEAERFRTKFKLTLGGVDNYSAAKLPEFDGLILAGALSAAAEAAAWLKPILARLRQGAALVVIEWQADGPLDIGPDLERRFKRGKLCRLLRDAGFGQPELLADQPSYYVVRAYKKPPAPLPHAGEFVSVATLAELPKNTMKPVTIFGQQLIVANTGREIVAFAQTCPHQGTSLYRGKLKGRQIMCPLHFYMWNVCTGEPIEPADEDILPLYPVKVDLENGVIRVALSLAT